MRIAPNEGRAVPVGRAGTVERGGFPEALGRGGEAVGAGEAALDALLA